LKTSTPVTTSQSKAHTEPPPLPPSTTKENSGNQDIYLEIMDRTSSNHVWHRFARGRPYNSYQNISKGYWIAHHQIAKNKRSPEFARLAGMIGKDIQQTTLKLSQLAQLDEHNNNVVMMLQSKLADTSLGFKDVLEIRTQVRIQVLTFDWHSDTNQLYTSNMKATRDRSEQFHFNTPGVTTTTQSVLRSRPTSSSPFNNSHQSTDSPLYATQQAGVASAVNRSLYDSKGKGKSTTQDSERISSFGHGEKILISQLATMVAQQGEQVQRIDQDTMDIESNIQSAQSELLKFYSSISGNRMLMFKIFGMIMVFFLLFVLLT
ncbi:hypothetical protein PSHT_10005, partial [Puccinia striiformis]